MSATASLSGIRSQEVPLPGSERIIRRAAATAWLVTLLVMTLVPTPSLELFNRPAFCLLCGAQGSADAILNMLLFVPLGVLMARTKNAPLRAAAVGLALSLGVESAQLLVPGRQPALGDLVWNASGAALGVYLHHVVLDRLRRTRASDASGLAVSVVAGLSVIAMGWLLEPIPSSELYWSLWTPQLGGMAYYDGRIIDTRLDGQSIPSGEFP
ncbi:MAG: VanZ family protein, partial [Gemmatimonadota bacterium]|nr:VanZ family protein [Gemmatimonadota bacterium]